MITINGKAIPSVIGQDKGSNSLFLFDVLGDDGRVARIRVWSFSMGTSGWWVDLYGVPADRIISAE